MERRSLRVLIIEDNPGDIYLLKEALAAQVRCEFKVIQNGHEAFEFLRKHANAESGVCPELIVLDLNLPGRDGSEILDLVRKRPELQFIKIAIVSSSPEDVLRERAAEADCYLTKPPDLDKYMSLGREILCGAGYITA